MPPTLLLSCDSVGKGFGARPLFENLSFGDLRGGPRRPDRAERVGEVDAAQDPRRHRGARTPAPCSLRRGARMGYVPQDPEFPKGKTVEEVRRRRPGGRSRRGLREGHPGRHRPRAGRLQRSGAARWTSSPAAGASAWRSPARWPSQPDVLLMDEPTNHLDVEGILWLEDLLQSEPLAYLVVSHDRYFLENVTSRVLELDRRYPGRHLPGAGGATATSSRSARRCCATRPSTRPRSPTRCATRSNG